jgi:hypothetical protein
MSDNQSENPNNLLDLELIRSNLPKYSTEKLCSMVVCNRYFGFSPEVTIICMEELAKRRAEGEVFPFESHIDQAYNQLPVLTVTGTLPDLRSTLQQMVKANKKANR